MRKNESYANWSTSMMGEGAGSKGASWRRGSKAAEWQTAWNDGGLAGAARKDGGLARTSQQWQT